jgi:hypothetical protein
MYDRDQSALVPPDVEYGLFPHDVRFAKRLLHLGRILPIRLLDYARPSIQGILDSRKSAGELSDVAFASDLHINSFPFWEIPVKAGTSARELLPFEA